MIDLRDSLQGEAKARVDQAILQANAQIVQLVEQVQREAESPTKLPEQVKNPVWRPNFKHHDAITRRVKTAVEAMERDEQQTEKASAGPMISLEDELPPFLSQEPPLSLKVAARGPGSTPLYTGRHLETRRRTLSQRLSMGREEAFCRQLSRTSFTQYRRIEATPYERNFPERVVVNPALDT